MALEDLAMMSAEPNMTVLYPSDAVCAERLVALAAYHPGPAYLRMSRPKTPVIYANDAAFAIGGSTVLRQSANDVATVVGAGVTLFEALKAHDLLAAEGIAIRVVDAYSIQPIDAETMRRCARETGRIITVEDHYVVGGLGDAVARAVAADGAAVERLAVRGDPAQRHARPADRRLRVVGPPHRRGGTREVIGARPESPPTSRPRPRR